MLSLVTTASLNKGTSWRIISLANQVFEARRQRPCSGKSVW